MEELERDLKELFERHGYEPYALQVKPGMPMTGYEMVSVSAFIRKSDGTEPQEPLD